ncbi:hypothetical protein GQ457_05G017600 [Hibiscus cannabinus]
MTKTSPQFSSNPKRTSQPEIVYGFNDQGDSSSLIIICHHLNGNNFLKWSQSIRIFLLGRDHIVAVMIFQLMHQPSQAHNKLNENKYSYREWQRKAEDMYGGGKIEDISGEMHKPIFWMAMMVKDYHQRQVKFIKKEPQDLPLEALKGVSLEERWVIYQKEFNDVKGVQIYVDDIIFDSTNESFCQDFVKLMQGEFEMSMMRELSFFLGLQIKQMKDVIFINQAKYINDMLKKFALENVKLRATPMRSFTKLVKDEEGKWFDLKLYRSMIDSFALSYHKYTIYFVCLRARCQACPKESHLHAIKRIFRYLRDTPNLGLWYRRDSSFSFHAYSVVDYECCKIDRKRTSGTCQFLGNMLISLFLKKQNSVALSTTEGKYISTDGCCAQVLWMKQQL